MLYKVHFNYKLKSLQGMTLAELILTITIIGVVAAVTIPPLMYNINSFANKQALKKNYASVAQAIVMLSTDQRGTLASLGTGNATIRNAILPYLKYKETCDNGAGNCFSAKITSDDNTIAYTNFDTASILLDNGASVSFNYSDPTCSTNVGGYNTCGNVIIANKGQHGPERWGQDIYGAYILPGSLKPYGFDSDNVNPASTTCATGSETSGLGCAYPYIYDLIVSAPIVTSGGTCATDTTLGQSCTDNNGVQAIYEGYCPPDMTLSLDTGSYTVDQAVSSNQWQQYYSGGNYESSQTSQKDPNCNSSKKLYITSSMPPTSNPNCEFYSMYGDCEMTEQNAINYCASLNPGGVDIGPNGWRLASADQLDYLESRYALNQYNYISSTQWQYGSWTMINNESNGQDISEGYMIDNYALPYGSVQCVKNGN